MDFPAVSQFEIWNANSDTKHEDHENDDGHDGHDQQTKTGWMARHQHDSRFVLCKQMFDVEHWSWLLDHQIRHRSVQIQWDWNISIEYIAKQFY